ncbi:hypothetical protein ATY81_21920 [Rhizobium sp. R72]|uniref:plasmid mobilization protein n=1 Tax=unclassified Rhizobium TaxID=2613769 RepID=UPI000B73D634|nr:MULTISPECIES: hypothetical protein [unclassified Rhizobium]OWW02313.1 hypothetical protein ATY81_21920 [Rhizobium sp. R72]OWW02447.1 hypothetical protein ATY80_21920 [Rhizobium sp. R711]
MARTRQIAPIKTAQNERKAHVVHARFTASELAAVHNAAEQAELTVSAFIRSLTLEGAGVEPFLTAEDRAIFEFLHRDMRIIGMNLNSLARLAYRQFDPGEVSELLSGLLPVAAGLALELNRLKRRTGRRVGGPA